MARRKKKGRSGGNGPAPIVFEDLDGTPSGQQLADDDDDEFVDPLDGEPGEGAITDDEPDPRADDPFAEESEGEEEPAEPEPEEPEEEPEPDDDGEIKDPKLKALIESQRRQIEALERERGLSQKQLEHANKTLNERRVKEVEDGIVQARSALKVAIEDGDTDKQVELQDRLAELHATKREVAATQAQQTESIEPQTDGASMVRAQTPAAERWIRGKSWINNPAYAAQNRELIRVAGVLVEDGYDPAGADYYAELERRMKRRNPELFSEAPARRPARQAVAPVSRDDPRRLSSKKSVTLTSEDRANMVRFGLDPSDKDHVREYARNKASEERPRV